MGKCPRYGKCTIDGSLLNSVGAEDTGSERYRYEHIMCKGKGALQNQWLNCVNYNDAHDLYCAEYKLLKDSLVKVKIVTILLFVLSVIFLFCGKAHPSYGTKEPYFNGWIEESIPWNDISTGFFWAVFFFLFVFFLSQRRRVLRWIFMILGLLFIIPLLEATRDSVFFLISSICVIAAFILAKIQYRYD